MKKFLKNIEVAKISQKRKGAYFILEIAFFLIFVAIITNGMIGMLGDTDGARITTAQQELEQIRTAIVQYRVYHKDGDSGLTVGSGDLKVLLSDLASTDSVDGRTHKAFLSESGTRWTKSDGIKDPWGNPYILQVFNGHECICSTVGGETASDKYLKVQIK